LGQKTNRLPIWTSQYERNSLILSLHFLLETWIECLQNTNGMFWIYSDTPSTTIPLSRPL